MRPVLLSLSITLLFTTFPSSRAGKHLLTLKGGRQFLVETSGPIEEKPRAAKERATNKHVLTSKDRRQSSGHAEEKPIVGKDLLTSKNGRRFVRPEKERATNRQEKDYILNGKLVRISFLFIIPSLTSSKSWRMRYFD